MKRKVSNCKWLGISDLNLLFTQAREHIFFEPLRQILVDEENLKGMKWIDSESESNNEDFGAKISA